jgi:hypothetical protein
MFGREATAQWGDSFMADVFIPYGGKGDLTGPREAR